jgi:proteasome beta subunit
LAARIPSFTHFLSSYAPEMLPVPDFGPLAGSSDVAADVIKNLPHATTIVAVVTSRGVVMAGDRRATAGNIIASNAMEKVFPADRYSAVGHARPPRQAH